MSNLANAEFDHLELMKQDSWEARSKGTKAGKLSVEIRHLIEEMSRDVRCQTSNKVDPSEALLIRDCDRLKTAINELQDALRWFDHDMADHLDVLNEWWAAKHPDNDPEARWNDQYPERKD